MIDMIGKKFGKLTVIKKTSATKNGSIVWECECACGKTRLATSRELNSGSVKSCGCLRKERYDLVGQKFGKLTVIKSETLGSHRTFLCKCDCGNEISVRGDSLRRGKTVSCGCAKSSESKIESLKAGRKLQEHTSSVFYQGTLSKNNTTGFNGISFIKGKYRASIGYKNKTYYLISDSDIEIAKSVRKEADEAVKNGTFEEWLQQFRNDNKTKSRR